MPNQNKKTKKQCFFGIGVDIEECVRFEKNAPKKSNSFLRKIFTQRELDYCLSKQRPAQHLAARYAGKEAVVKALGDMAAGKSDFLLEYKDIEIVNDKKGVPRVRIKRKFVDNLIVHLSLSHCREKAVAFSIIQTIYEES